MVKKKLISFAVAVLLLTAAATQTIAAAFSDVPDNHPYKAAIDFCQAKGYVVGVGGTRFAPEGTLTRVQLATVWCRFLGIDITNHRFTDVTQLKNYYDTMAIVMNSLGILSGTSGSAFSPDAALTREQLAVVVKRTFGIRAADQNGYKQYGDNALISTWAQDAISSCLNADVFAGLYDGENLQPQKAVTREEICKLIYNLAQPAYTVTVDTMTGGEITALPSVAHPGTTIRLTVIPDAGKQLKQGTLKFNGTVINGTTFTMPAEDVLITAEFEDRPFGLYSISVTHLPSKVNYQAGETLDLSGLVVTAVYTDNSQKDVTGYSTSPAEGSALSATGTNTVTVSYTENGITKSCSFNVQVT